jgi:heat shock protein HtpX
LLAIFLAPLAAMLVQMAISRTREYAADRSMDNLFSTQPSTENRIAALEELAGARAA